MGGIEREDVVAVEKFLAAGLDGRQHGFVGDASAKTVVAKFAQHRGRNVGSAAGDVVHREERIGRGREANRGQSQNRE